MIQNVDGDPGSEGSFWRRSAVDLATYVMWLVRLVEGREPTLFDLYEIATAPAHFKTWLDALRIKATAKKVDPAELDAVEFWHKAKIVDISEHLRSSIAAGLNGVLSMFAVPAIRKAFCAAEQAAALRSFDDVIGKGRIVCLRIPHEELKTVSEVVGTLMKLQWYGAVLNRLPRAEAKGVEGRDVFFFSDEYDVVLSMPADGTYLSKGREARAINILLTQSLEMIFGKVRNEHQAGSLLSNCRTKICLRRRGQLHGQVFRRPVRRRGPDEGVHQLEGDDTRATFSFVDGKVIGDPAEVGESRTPSPHIPCPGGRTGLERP